MTDVLIGEQGVGSKNGGWLDVERQGVMGIINNSESQTYVLEHFPKISEDVRRLPKTFEEDPKMFR